MDLSFMPGWNLQFPLHCIWGGGKRPAGNLAQA
jgi:hypothetical protein